ncbi:MAG TPA: hypothetical protein VNI54_10130 [Thermoanaerobaculia bacterium]|nr:hypothetical protein [Thermoanaerobaculia bacterium]
MRFKKSRFGPRLVEAARSGRHYRDVHVFIGGTGAVGGSSALQMVEMLEEMMTINPPSSPGDVPVLIVTGRSDDEVHSFESRLKRVTRTRWGAGVTPRHFEQGFLTPGGVYVAVSRFELRPIPGLEIVNEADASQRAGAVDEFLRVANVGGNEDSLLSYVRGVKPITGFLEDRRSRLRDYGDKPFRSVLLGFPLPSILAYQTGGLGIVGAALGFGDDFTARMKREFEHTFADDLAAVRDKWDARVLVAHTTGVGGMYDETPDGETTLRLSFAHAARDEFLRNKHHEAENLTSTYAQRGVLMLVTAAAIGIDEVRTRERIPLHGGIIKALRDAPHEIYRGAREKKQFVQVFKPTTLRFSGAAAAPGRPKSAPEAGAAPLHFKRGEDLRPSWVIRSGENGFFSVANADALYRVMKVASVSELGHVLATTGLLGDDPNLPWFEDGICYYTETDNSRPVFDFLYQPVLFDAQLSGIDPVALQDLGSAKHQAELHTLGLLILLHRLRTLDADAIEEYPDESFNARRFFLENSRPLTFRDVESWDMETLARDLRTLVTADKPGQLLPLKPLIDPGQFGARDEAHLAVMKVVLDAVFAVPSLGSPIVVENEKGETLVRSGYWIAPLGKIATHEDALEQLLPDEESRHFQMAVNGFIDLRPHAIVSDAKLPGEGAVTVHGDEASYRERLRSLTPYSFFATCGLIAILHRLRALGAMLTQARTDLGTMQDWVWTMQRDSRGHTYVVPGVVEALRMIAEGQEKTTGTEWLDGIWGYERRLPRQRVDEILEAVERRKQ